MENLSVVNAVTTYEGKPKSLMQSPLTKGNVDIPIGSKLLSRRNFRSYTQMRHGWDVIHDRTLEHLLDSFEATVGIHF